MSAPRTLAALRPGQSATILDVTGDDGVSVRLMEMGLVEGEPITCIGAAPLGDPVEYELRGYRISIRGSEARRVTIAET